jgi:hypothetical protein
VGGVDMKAYFDDDTQFCDLVSLYDGYVEKWVGVFYVTVYILDNGEYIKFMIQGHAHMLH